MIRLMIVDDSAATRELLIYALASEPDIELAGIASDGEEAVTLSKRVHPDIILMDINMPRLNGYEASRQIMEENPVPILLMTATWDIKEVEEKIKKMHLGVLGSFEKPYGPGHPRYKELYEKILAAIRLMSDVKVVRRWKNSDATTVDKFEVTEKKVSSVVLIGSSTGGPPILHSLLQGLPFNYSLPILIAQHMNAEFIESFVQWLNNQCALNVILATEGEKITGGNVYIAPPLYHLTLDNNRIRLIKGEANELYIPSVSRLFASVQPTDAKNIVAVLLSGMGKDGAEETVRLKNAGAITIGQNETTSVVYGMVNEAVKLGGIEFILPPMGILEMLLAIEADKRSYYESYCT
ncbi:MAG: chemotaxis protein CheB [Sulfuricurvum sp.]|nr:chemotaxis protein CheB [Sulfuricurvum sp.]